MNHFTLFPKSYFTAQVFKIPANIKQSCIGSVGQNKKCRNMMIWAYEPYIMILMGLTSNVARRRPEVCGTCAPVWPHTPTNSTNPASLPCPTTTFCTSWCNRPWSLHQTRSRDPGHVRAVAFPRIQKFASQLFILGFFWDMEHLSFYCERINGAQLGKR